MKINVHSNTFHESNFYLLQNCYNQYKYKYYKYYKFYNFCNFYNFYILYFLYFFVSFIFFIKPLNCQLFITQFLLNNFLLKIIKTDIKQINVTYLYNKLNFIILIILIIRYINYINYTLKVIWTGIFVGLKEYFVRWKENYGRDGSLTRLISCRWVNASFDTVLLAELEHVYTITMRLSISGTLGHISQTGFTFIVH